MDDLSMSLVRLVRYNKDGSFATHKNRQRGLTAMAKELKELGYKLPSARSLKPKHVHALVEQWQQKDLTDETIKNRLTWLRWWAERIEKGNVVPRENKTFGLSDDPKEPQNKALVLDNTKLNKIECPYVQASLMLQAAFGLRREEAIKFIPVQATSPQQIILKPSWTKGGKKRSIPITTHKQQQALMFASKIAQKNSLIPQDKSYVEHLKTYERLTLVADLRNTHGLRHQYAQERYLTLTKMPCPLQGGKHWHQMTREEQVQDRAARKIISHELGHSRLRITDTYLGRAMA